MHISYITYYILCILYITYIYIHCCIYIHIYIYCCIYVCICLCKRCSNLRAGKLSHQAPLVAWIKISFDLSDLSQLQWQCKKLPSRRYSGRCGLWPAPVTAECEATGVVKMDTRWCHCFKIPTNDVCILYVWGCHSSHTWFYNHIMTISFTGTPYPNSS